MSTRPFGSTGRIGRPVRTCGRLALLAALALWGTGARAEDLPPPPADAEALVRQASSKVDEFYLRPGADFSGYHELLLAPVQVSFSKYWASEHRQVRPEQVLRLRTQLAAEARDAFRRQVQRDRSYRMADRPGPGVLEVRALIVNLDLYAPEIEDSAIRRNYVLSAGKATLVAELRDSATGTLLARVVDRREMPWSPDLMLATTVTNSADVATLVGNWTRTLRRFLDIAQSDGKGK